MKAKFVRIELSKRAGFIGYYLNPKRDKLWICVIPFIAIYFKLQSEDSNETLF